MREQPRRDWQPATKRQWVKPEVREFALTDDVLRLFASAASTEALDGDSGMARVSSR